MFHKEVTEVDLDPSGSVGQEKLPEMIGPYKVESLLNKGGMSTLYLAVDPNTKKTLAIKVLLPKYLSHPEMVDRFLKEAEIIKMASHPNIIKLYGQGKWEGGLFIAMEFIRGISLRQLILQNTVSLDRSLDIIIEVGNALGHLHNHGVIHRDLKPENILLTEEGGIKVIDFGIAQLHSEKDFESTKNRKMMGTPSYMSPEQKKRLPKVSFSADIYSLAIIAYELALGKLSYGVLQLSLLPHGLRVVLEKALEEDPQKRYSSVNEFIQAIQNYQKDKGDKLSHGIQEAPDFLQCAHNLLRPIKPITWSKIEFGIALQNSSKIPGFFYDFFSLREDNYGYIVAWPKTKDIKGIFYSMNLRGMIRSLTSWIGKEKKEILNQPEAYLAHINALLKEDLLGHIFNVSLLILRPSADQLVYMGCGGGGLWHIPAGRSKPRRMTAQNAFFGKDTSQTLIASNHNWNIGDNLILMSHDFSDIITDEEFELAVKEVLVLPPAKQSERLLQKLWGTLPMKAKNNILATTSIQRRG